MVSLGCEYFYYWDIGLHRFQGEWRLSWQRQNITDTNCNKANINDFNVPYQHALADRIVGSIITLLSFLTMLMAMYRYAKVVALLACLREKLRGRTGLHWAYTVLASSIIMAAVLGLIRH
jgi:hypothetical protein